MHRFLAIFFLAPSVLFGQLENYEKYMPSSKLGEVIHHSYYSLSYLEEYKIPEWTIYMLIKTTVNDLNFKFNLTRDFSFSYLF